MSSPADGVGPGGATHQHGKKKRPDLDKSHGPSRPSSSRHGSSFLDRLHRKHDAKHHPEQAPLLAGPEPDETPEPESHPQSRPKPSLRDLIDRVKNAAAVAPHIKKAIAALKDGGRAVGRGSDRAARNTGRHVKRNQKSYMAAIIALLTATTVGLGIAYGLYSSPTHKSLYCTSPSCVQAADTILMNMHPDVATQVSSNDVFGVNSYPIDPCTNFDQFVCGGFAQHHQFRSDQNEIYTGTVMADEVDVVLKKVLEQPMSKVAGSDKSIFKLAKADYKSCMDEQVLQDLGIDPLKKVIDSMRTDLPIGKRFSRSREYRLQISAATGEPRGDFLTDIMIDNILLGAPTLIDFRIETDDTAPRRQILFTSPVQAIGLPFPELYDDPDSDIQVDYRKACNESLGIFYRTPTNATAIWYGSLKSTGTSGKLSDKVVDFETRLAKIIPRPEQKQDLKQANTKIALSDFNKILPQVNMQALYAGVAGTTTAPKTMVLSSPKYLQDLSGLLQETDKTTIQAFFVWKAVQSKADHIEDNLLATLKTFNAKVRGTKTDQPEERWRHCVRSVSNDLGWITSRFYINNDFDSSLDKPATQIIDDVKVAFTKILIASTWMSQDDREAAATKARSIKANIGYPTTKPNVKDASSVEEFYKFDDLQMADDTYFTNGVKATHQQIRRQWVKAAGASTDQGEWPMYSTTLNTYYDPASNSMFIPAAMLRPPVLYDHSLPSYVSYGSLGTVAGHGISHAFGPIGAHYYANGTYDDDWWSDETAKKFYSKARCFIDQYSSYTVPGPDGDLDVNGNLTLPEAIADAGSAHAAFRAWKEHEQKIESKLLPGLKAFSKDQVFWLSYGTFWCSKMTPERAVEVVLTDPHGPKSVRILGTVANSKAFREAWSCPSKEPTCDL